MKKSIGLKIKEVRVHYGLNQEEFSAKIGIKQSNLSHLERFGSKISIEIIQNIISNFNISPDWLLTGQGSMLRDFHEDNRYVKNNSVVGGNLSGNGNNINQNNTAELIDELRAQLLAKDKQIERLLAIIDKMSATD